MKIPFDSNGTLFPSSRAIRFNDIWPANRFLSIEYVRLGVVTAVTFTCILVIFRWNLIDAMLLAFCEFAADIFWPREWIITSDTVLWKKKQFDKWHRASQHVSPKAMSIDNSEFPNIKIQVTTSDPQTSYIYKVRVADASTLLRLQWFQRYHSNNG